MPCNTDLMIKKETDEIVKVLDSVEFDSQKFSDWLTSKKFEPDLYQGKRQLNYTTSPPQ